MSTPLSPALKSWQAAFDAQPSDEQRRLAFANFLARGLPTAKNDAWKYTDLRRLALKEFRTPTKSLASTGDAEKLFSMNTSLRLVFIDGHLSESLSTKAPASVRVSQSIDNVIRGEAFELLNRALTVTPIRLDVSADAKALDPIYVAFLWTENSKALMAHPRLEIALSSKANATLVEHHIGSVSESNLTNAALQIDVGADASLEHIRLQEDVHGNFNIGSIRATVARNGSYVNHQHILGAGLARTDILIELQGEEARTELHGLVFANQTQHLDVRTCIDHQVPNTQSREDYRGIADHRGRVIFNGKVIVAKDAQRTDAAQSSRNLLLSAQAEIDTRPELEIYANDVKCAHGATVGQLDANSLFYLQSRGIDATEARSLLTQAFATEVIERLPVQAVRDRVLAQLKTRMKTEGSAL